MVKNHLKRIAAPKTWNIERKESRFIMRPLPGPHALKQGMPLSLLLREVVKVAKTTKEAKQIINIKDVFVDKRKRTEEKFPVGLMDIVEFPQLEAQYRVLLDRKGQLNAVPASEKESTLKLARVEDKIRSKGGRTTVRLSGGRTLTVDKDSYKVGDSLLITLPDQNVQEHFKLENGALVLLIGGKRAGKTAQVEEIGKNKIILKLSKTERFETLKKYAFVIGKDKPALPSIKMIMA